MKFWDNVKPSVVVTDFLLNEFGNDTMATVASDQPVSGQLGLTVLGLSEIAKIPELLTRARQSIESGVSSFQDAAEFLAEAQELGVSQRQLAASWRVSMFFLSAEHTNCGDPE